MTTAPTVNSQPALGHERRALAALAAVLLAGTIAAQPVTAADEVPAISGNSAVMAAPFTDPGNG